MTDSERRVRCQWCYEALVWREPWGWTHAEPAEDADHEGVPAAPEPVS